MMERPYEIEDPITENPISARYTDQIRAEKYTGNKAMAVVDEPRSCSHCIFHWVRWFSPVWSQASSTMSYHDKPGTAGLGCNLANNGIIVVIDHDDNEYKPDWCPLAPMEEGA